MFESVTDQLSSLFYPTTCLSCGSDQPHSQLGRACNECWSSTKLFDGSEALCEKCGAMLVTKSLGSGGSCWQCDEFHFDKARACGPYSEALKAEIIDLKLTPRLSRQLTDVIVQTVETFNLNTATIIVPVPLTKRRRMERGFNQAEVIAAVVSRESSIPIDSLSLQRIVHSPTHRIGMDRKARDLSVRNAFSVVRPNLVKGTNVLLVDDVYTTGATVSYCAKALKKSGARSVNVFTIARAQLRQ